MRLLTSPWSETFKEFLDQIKQSCLLVSPFISSSPLQRLALLGEREKPPQIHILTNLAVDNMLQGSIDPQAILDLWRQIPGVTLKHLPGLHAKVYVADDTLAIVTSANLTEGGLWRNYEYGVAITETPIVDEIAQDLYQYGELGSEVSFVELEQLAQVSQQLRERQSEVLNSASSALRKEFESRIEAASESLRYLRAKPGESTNSIFARTIGYLLKGDQLSTQQMHDRVQRIHPDLCDDSIDRVINGVHFGKRWKHMVRNAQQFLKKDGRIKLEGHKWHLIR